MKHIFKKMANGEITKDAAGNWTKEHFLKCHPNEPMCRVKYANGVVIDWYGDDIDAFNTISKDKMAFFFIVGVGFLKGDSNE